MPTSDIISIATVNCQGLATPSKRKDVLNYLKQKGYSILCLQDTHFISECEPYIESQWGYKCIFNSYTSNSRGVCILFNNNFEFKINRIKKDCEGNLLALDMSIEDNKVTLINIYGPNTDSPQFYENVRDTFLEYNNDYFILCGDFNLTLNPSLDTHNYYSVNNPKARAKVLEIMEDLQILDYYRILNPDKKIYTWRKKNPLKQSRLDFFLISDSLTNLVENCNIKPGYRTDHSIVVIEIKFNPFRKGNGIWKFNNSLLTDKDYVTKVKEVIQSTSSQYLYDVGDSDFQCKNGIDESLFLEVLMMEIRGATIAYSSYKKKEKGKKEKELLDEIEALESDSTTNIDILSEKKTALENFRKEKLQGHMIRSRARWVEEGEKPSKYFCSLESRNYLNKTIRKIELEDAQTIFNQSDILQNIKLFYETLYRNNDSNLIDIELNNIISENNTPKLDIHSAKKLEKDIVESEVLEVLKNMKNNKSPGSDGYTTEFFKFFWSDIKYFVVRAINCIFRKGELPITQRLGIISCLPKGDKPRQFLKNWRPITLLNVLYKIISGCLSHRIKQVLDYIISDTQSGFLKGRYIGENTRFIYDIMAYTEKNNIPGLLVLIDFEKAFDSMSWSFIYKVLKYFGFGGNFIQWIKILNTKFRASILQSGFLSEQFDIQRGCRQGDPIAPYLFILCAEILAILIKQNKNIKGICIENTEHKISQYADDTSLALDGSPQSLFAALDTIEYFSTFSGLRINSSKTKIVWIGSKKFSDQVFHHTRWKLVWGSTTFNLLGINFSVNLSEIEDINFGIQIPKIVALIEQWKRRVLTPIGRTTVIKTLLIPKLNHLFISLPSPKNETISYLYKIIFEFLWKSRVDKVKRSVTTQDYLSGGLKMVDINNFITSLKCSWIKRLTSSICPKPWMNIFFAMYGNDILKKIYDFGDSFIEQLLGKSNAFWRDVFNSWFLYLKTCQHLPSIKSKFQNIPVWYNSNIKIAGKPVFIAKWYEKGITVVKDFFDTECNFLTLDIQS